MTPVGRKTDSTPGRVANKFMNSDGTIKAAFDLWKVDYSYIDNVIFDEKEKRLTIVHRYGMMTSKTSEWGADIP